MATIPVRDANSVIVDLEKPLIPGRANAALSRPVVFSNEDFAALSALQTILTLVRDLNASALKNLLVDETGDPLAVSTKTIDELIYPLVFPGDVVFIRPADATPYAVGDLIANNTSAGSVAPLSFGGAVKNSALGGTGRIVGWIGSKSASAACTIRYHFLRTSHVVTNGDNGALVFTSLDIENYFGYMDVVFAGTNDAIGSGGALVNKSLSPPVEYNLAASDTLYVFLQALTVFTPASAGIYGGRPIFEVRS